MAPCSLVVSDQPAFWHLDAARGPSTPSFNHLVGGHLQAQWHRQAERLRSFEIDDQFKFRRPHNWKVGWLSALENAASVDASLPIHVEDIGRIAEQPSRQHSLAYSVNGRQSVA